MKEHFEELKNFYREILNDRVSSRKKYNILILATLLKIIEKYPDLRFCQLLEEVNKGKDYFFEEPSETLERFKTFLNDEENV